MKFFPIDKVCICVCADAQVGALCVELKKNANEVGCACLSVRETTHFSLSHSLSKGISLF